VFQPKEHLVAHPVGSAIKSGGFFVITLWMSYLLSPVPTSLLTIAKTFYQQKKRAKFD
jgi:hypothetical protein